MPCSRCHASCCRNLLHTITPFDALRIADALDLQFDDFTDFWVMPPESADSEPEDGVPVVLIRDGLSNVPTRVLVLKNVKSTLPIGGRRCVFLVEGLRQSPLPGDRDHPGQTAFGRCGIYAQRPLMCRTYPLVVNMEHRLPMLAAKRRELGATEHAAGSVVDLCPDDWTAEMVQPDIDAVTTNLARDRYEWLRYAELAAEWNQDPGDRAAFFAFMAEGWKTQVIETSEPVTMARGSTTRPLQLRDIFPQHMAINRLSRQTD